jgi:predicted N-acetyltransferase YhbS
MAIEVLTAETHRGRQAIEEVMRRSYTTDIDCVSPEWARVRVADGVPVSFILVAPDWSLRFTGGDMPCAFIDDVATREDRRGEGHFRGIIEHTFDALRAAGMPAAITHGRYQLYRRFGFDVFTHHCGVFVTPESVERRFGAPSGAEDCEGLMTVEESKHILDDLLVVGEIRAETFDECLAVLRAAAALARQRGKARILFEHPPIDVPGYPGHPELETELAALARACGGEVRVQGADPEGRPVPDADWLKVLDPAAFTRQAVDLLGTGSQTAADGAVCIETEAGAVSIEASLGTVAVGSEAPPEAVRATWPSAALGQLVTGCRSARVLAAIRGTPLPERALALLHSLFPRQWRLSRNESWTYAS